MEIAIVFLIIAIVFVSQTIKIVPQQNAWACCAAWICSTACWRRESLAMARC